MRKRKEKQQALPVAVKEKKTGIRGKLERIVDGCPPWVRSGVGYVYLAASFVLLDVWLRHATRSIGLYPLTALAPNLFTVVWAALLTLIVSLIPRRLPKRILYGVLYTVMLIYVVVQDGYYQLMGKMLYFSDVLYAGEGGEFLSYAKKLISASFTIQIIILIAVGVTGVIFMPKARPRGWLPWAGKGVGIAACVAGLCLTPGAYGKYNADSWDSYLSPAFEYRTFTNSTFDMQLMGAYQYFYRNTVLTLEQTGILGTAGTAEDWEEIDQFFSEKPQHEDNGMTGLLQGKNLILVMMESLDDWLITPEDTPTIYSMMQNSINFTQFYTPEYASGYTFNTEFAANVGVYPFTNSNAAYGLGSHYFPNALGNLFTDAGYTANSFHRSSGTFYNRSVMHKAFGYEKYNGFYGYTDAIYSRENDMYLFEHYDLFHDLISGDPFMSFVITYSPHLPYDLSDETSVEALELHPEYVDVEGDPSPLSVLKAKVRLTDDMFAGLLSRLEEEGLLENTVIAAFTDHYVYGYPDQEYVQEESEAAGSSILQRTPFFIYSREFEGNGLEVDKVLQTTDILPTLANLFGLKVPENVMGNDAFDENYPGYVIFPSLTWLTGQTYMKNGSVVWNNGMTEEEIEQMNEFVQRCYVVNDLILNTDYYRKDS